MLEPLPSADAPATNRRPVAPAPWWSFGMVWFMLSGPALVVVAGFATLAIAIEHPDVELHQDAPAVATPTAPPMVPSATRQPGEWAMPSGH